MDIFVASTSPHKIAAAERACAPIFGSKCNIEGIKAASDINEQPIGHDQTLEGALNRLKNLKRLIGTTRYDLLIAFEGGIFPVEMIGRGRRWFDTGWTVVEDAYGIEAYSPSSGIEYDSLDVEAAHERDFGKHTVGSVLAEQRGIDDTDPHEQLTCGLVRRADVLTQSLTAAIGQLLTKSTSVRALKSLRRL